MSKQLVAPRITPPAGSSGSGRSSVRLPDDLVSEQVRRVELFASVCLFMWMFGFVMDSFVFPAMGLHGVVRPQLMLEAIAVSVCAMVWLLLRFAPWPARRKADFGLWLMLLNAFGVTVIDTAAPQQVYVLGVPSWTAVVILASAMIMPNTPRKTLLASLAAATMGPIGTWIAYLRGFDTPTVGQSIVLYLPNFIWAAVATLPSAMFQRLGRRLNEARALGSYELIEQLGAGGMGAVWRGRHRFLARDAAIKLVRAEALGDTASAAQSQLRRFEREAQATALLRSQHSIRLFDFGAAEDGSFYYVMELLEGRDLESLVKEFGALPPERAMFVLRQVCHSLAEAHERGLVHRDIKPANIFLCRMGLEFDFVKVLDFGLVQTRKHDPAMADTETLITAQHIIGTPAYMAPEMILGREDVDKRADVYAIGCVAFFLLTGTRVFQDGTQMQTLIDHVHTEPQPPSARASSPIPREIDRLVLHCLKKKPEERPRDAAELLERITALNLAAGWSHTHARAWWEARLPELAAPLSGH